MPSKSQMAFALGGVSGWIGERGWESGLRFGIDLVEESTAIVLVEDTGEAPGLLLEGLHVLDLNK